MRQGCLQCISRLTRFGFKMKKTKQKIKPGLYYFLSVDVLKIVRRLICLLKTWYFKCRLSTLLCRSVSLRGTGTTGHPIYPFSASARPSMLFPLLTVPIIGDHQPCQSFLKAHQSPTPHPSWMTSLVLPNTQTICIHHCSSDYIAKSGPHHTI